MSTWETPTTTPARIGSWLVGHFKDPADIRHSRDTEVKRSTGEVETVVLERPGDYAVWGRGVDHTWEALADSIMITVRWPSLA